MNTILRDSSLGVQKKINDNTCLSGNVPLQDLEDCLDCGHGIVAFLGWNGDCALLEIWSGDTMTFEISSNFISEECSPFWSRNGILGFVQTTSRNVKSWAITVPNLLRHEPRSLSNSIEGQIIKIVMLRWFNRIPHVLMNMVLLYCPTDMFYRLVTSDILKM